MSFIRSLSNPEALYIWDDVGGYIAITSPQHKHILTANRRDWYSLIRKYNKGGWYNAKAGTLQLQEVVMKTGPWEEIIPAGSRYTGGEKKGRLMPKRDRGRQPVEFKMVLSIRKPGKRVKKVTMWRVTWDYIAGHEQCGQPWGHEKKRRKKR